MKKLIFIDFLSGYKTYIVGLGFIMTGLGPFFTTWDPSEINSEMILEGLGFIFIRKGIAKATL